MLDQFRQDLRYGVRGLARTPLFALTTILSVAIGVGAVTAIATIASALLLRTPPGVGDPARLASVGRTTDGQGFDNMSYPVFADYRDGSTRLSAIAAVRLEPLNVSLQGQEGGEPAQASVVSGNFFQILQARPALGRFFAPDEDRVPGANPVVVLSHAFWSRRFNSDSSIVGRAIVLNGTPFTVVGVAAERFQGPFVISPDMWAPIMTSSLLGMPEQLLTARQAVWLVAIGRLAPDASLGAAQAELSAIAVRLEADYPDMNQSHGVRVLPASLLPGDMRPMVARFMALLGAFAVLVLAIASTNVAGTLLARATARRREIAVRLAIGASRTQLVRQLLTESVLLFVAAGVAGLVIARWLVAGLFSFVPRLPVQLTVDARMDWRVFGFALGAAVIAGLAAGLVPAWQASRPELVPTLKVDGGGAPRRQRLRGGLLVGQISLSMLLLIVAGLFARALLRAGSIDPGFRTQGVHLASLDLQLARYDSTRGAQVMTTLMERARTLPNAESVALSAMIPLDGGGLGLGSLTVDGRTPPDERRGWAEDWNVVSPGYFEALDIPIVRGRAFGEADRSGSPDVAIVNETFARALWPERDPIGRVIRNEERTLTVVGVARDGKYRTLGESPRNFIYVAMAQRYMSRVTLLVRAPDEASLGAAMRRMVADVDRALPLLDSRTLEDQIGVSLFPQRLALWVAASLGGVALLLALLGIYGVTALNVAQRTRELGVRSALGARSGQIRGLVLRQGAVLAGIGVGIGALLAVGITRALGALLYGVPPTDAIAFAGAAGVLMLAALAASWIPARRAASVDPVVALRSE